MANTKKEIKKDLWVIQASVVKEYTVIFDNPITAMEAKNLFLEQEYADVLDEEELKVNYVISTRP